MTVQNNMTTPVGKDETILVDEQSENDYAVWIDYSEMASGDEFLFKVIITLATGIQKNYFEHVIDYKKISKGKVPLKYLPATTCKGIKITLQKTKDGKSSTIQPTNIGHQLITYQ